MKTRNLSLTRSERAFTLIELLVVMAIIATLAALLFPAFSGIKKGAAIKKARAEMLKVVMAIDAYKAQFGHYPPDNPDNVAVNQLYYELVGTKLVNSNEYQTESGQGAILTSGVPTFFGNKVSGFVNVTKGGGDDVQSAKNFVVGLRPNQYLDVVNNGVTGTVLGMLEKGPLMLNDSTGGKSINPWRYVSTNPTNNPGHFDLWVDLIIGGKTNRISNWSQKPELVAN